MNILMKLFRFIRWKIVRKLDFYRDIEKYRSLQESSDFKIDLNKKKMIYEKDISAAAVDGHYFLMDYYFARMIRNDSPSLHYDIGSRIDGFVTHLLVSGIPVVMFDVRPFSIPMEGLSFIQTDATQLDNIEDNSIRSLSSLHAIEHFGLGRYGDNIDPDGWKKALKSIQRVISTGGHFYLGLPIAPRNVLKFNAHRLFSPLTIINELDEMELISFSYIHDFKINEVIPPRIDNNNISMIKEEDCGLFCFRKK